MRDSRSDETDQRPRVLDRAFLRSSAVIAVAIAVMNVATYGYTIIAAHTIGKDAYGAFSALMGALLVISVLSLGLQATGARRIAAHPDQVVADRADRARRRAAQRARARVLSAWSWRPCSTRCCASTACPPRCWSAWRRCR